MKTVRAFAPGRTEIAGNHTDHQGGRAIAATLDCGIEIALEQNGGKRVSFASEGFEPFDIDVAVPGPRAEEAGTTAALVRGVVDLLTEAGLALGGFDATAASTIPSGGGLSSSAALELALICAVQELFDCGGDLLATPAERAALAARVEREYFGKPCGLLDQTAIAYGGVSSIDFSAGSDAPSVAAIDFDFESCGYALCLVDTHCDHSRYTDEYAQVARDMFDVAQFLGAARLCEVSEGEFESRLSDVRSALGDLPALRALHYYHEMQLVEEREAALRAGDMHAFLELTRRSGASSAQYLQNVSTSDRSEQPAMVALAMADCAAGSDGACRIHGGGFGGTVQAFVPVDACDAFASRIDVQLGAGSCKKYRITPRGAYAVPKGTGQMSRMFLVGD